MAPRLVLLHYAAWPVVGGVESVMATQARLLSAAGYEVQVVAGRGDAELVPEIDSRHPRVEEVARRLAAGDPARVEFDALRRLLGARLRPLLAGCHRVIVHNVLTMPQNLPLAAALVDAGHPILAWTHDLAWVDPRYAAYRRPGWPWSILHQAQPGVRYVAVSRERRRQLLSVMEGLRPGRTTVIPNGIDPETFWGIGPATRELVRRAGLEHADPLVLVPVRVTRRKRLELALEAAAHLRPAYPALRLVVSGPLGPHSADNRAYAADLSELRRRLRLEREVRFLHELAGQDARHPVDDAMIADLYRMADVVLLPSESEGFGLPVLEAALSRAPLVCADIPVLREIAGAGAWTFPAGAGPEAVAAAVRRALGGRVAGLRRRVLERYRWSTVLASMRRVIGADLD
ncbi:MAG TPA: glycosyltransferase family 4 protein [Candidatus Dormibacteraeota bacterium]|nr:glycosyltransferase family 4 protein [Candidatus Dormibacteraeota bacterium]